MNFQSINYYYEFNTKLKKEKLDMAVREVENYYCWNGVCWFIKCDIISTT